MIEKQRRLAAGFTRKYAIKFFHFFGRIAKIVGRGHHQRIGPGGQRIVSQLQRSGQGGVCDVDDKRHPAAFPAEVHKPPALFKIEVQELAGRAQQTDAVGSAVGQEIHQLQGGAEVGFPCAGPVRCNGCGKYAG